MNLLFTYRYCGTLINAKEQLASPLPTFQETGCPVRAMLGLYL